MELEIKVRQHPLADYDRDGVFWTWPGCKKRVPMLYETLRVRYKMSDEEFGELLYDIRGNPPLFEVFVVNALDSCKESAQILVHPDFTNAMSVLYVDAKQNLHIYVLSSDDTRFFEVKEGRYAYLIDNLEILLDHLHDSDDLVLRRAFKEAIIALNTTFKDTCPDLVAYARATLG